MVRFATFLAAEPYLTEEREDPGGPRVFRVLTEEKSILRGSTAWGGSARLWKGGGGLYVCME